MQGGRFQTSSEELINIAKSVGFENIRICI